MFKKILMAAGLAAAFSVSAQVAEAKVKVTIGIGSPADTATITTILSAAVIMAIIPARDTLSPIRVTGMETITIMGTACPAVRLVEFSGIAAIAMCAQSVVAAGFILSLPKRGATFSGSKFTREMAGFNPSGEFDARI